MGFFQNLFRPNRKCCCSHHVKQEPASLFTKEDSERIKHIDEKIVIGKIHAIAAHPDPKVTKVRVTKTEVAPGVIEQILCGGSNIAEGEIVAVATVGAKLGADFEIGERKIRGEVSRGMICSREELGLSHENEPNHGIWLMGDKFAEYLGTPLKDLV